MKIFPKNSEPPTTTAPKAAKSKGPAKAPKKELPAKKDLSPNEIREKLAANVQTSEAAKNKSLINSKKLGEGFLNESIKPEMIEVKKPEIESSETESDDQSPNPKDFVLKSDIAKNDPTDTNTQEKLKSVISRGAFSFNPKEREALEKILASS